MVHSPRSSSGANSRPTILFRDRKSTRLNSSHLVISYAVFCLKKKNDIACLLFPALQLGWYDLRHRHTVAAVFVQHPASTLVLELDYINTLVTLAPASRHSSS